MSKRPGLPYNLRKTILQRDDYTCLKCGRHKDLEIHHITPVCFGGSDFSGNLITLCHRCHKEAPDDPVSLFKYMRTSLPPDLEKSVHLCKIIVSLIKHDKSWRAALDEEPKVLDTLIDDFSRDVWKTIVSNEMSELSKMLSKYMGGFTSEEKLQEVQNEPPVRQ